MTKNDVKLVIFAEPSSLTAENPKNEKRKTTV